MIPVSTDGRGPVYAVSVDGLEHLIENLRDGDIRLGITELFQVALTNDCRIAEILKQQLLFGLLRRFGGLILVKEDGVVIAPIPEIQIHTSHEVRTSFTDLLSGSLIPAPPDVSTVCEWKQLCGGIPVHHIVWLILESLKANNDMEEFHLKSYSGVMNKLFYHGKKLTDLFSTTITQDRYPQLVRNLLEIGVMSLSAENESYSIDDFAVHRFCRVVMVSINQVHFQFPAFYQVVVKNSLPRTSSSADYEVRRFRCGIHRYHHALEMAGFNIEEVPQL